MKRAVVAIIVAAFVVSIMAQPAVAGCRHRHHHPGVAIGVGTVFLGSAILHSSHAHSCHKHCRHGHWQVKKVWVPPVYAKVWVPGHYNRLGKWVPGHWERSKKSTGYWKKEKIWVAGR